MAKKNVYLLMHFNPHNGLAKPWPSHPEQFRQLSDDRSDTTWYYNPFSGTRRNRYDIVDDQWGAGIQSVSSLYSEHPYTIGKDEPLRVMMYDPQTGKPRPWPSFVPHYLEVHEDKLWKFNPFTREPINDLVRDKVWLEMKYGDGDAM